MKVLDKKETEIEIISSSGKFRTQIQIKFWTGLRGTVIMRPKIGRLDNGEEQDSDAMKKLNFGGQMETNWLKSVNIGRKIEKKGSRIDKNGSTDESIVRKVEKSGPVRWASMALCWGGRCLLNKMFSNKKKCFPSLFCYGNFDNAYIYFFCRECTSIWKREFPLQGNIA